MTAVMTEPVMGTCPAGTCTSQARSLLASNICAGCDRLCRTGVDGGYNTPSLSMGPKLPTGCVLHPW